MAGAGHSKERNDHPTTADTPTPFPVALILGYTAIALTALEYFGYPGFFQEHFPGAAEIHNGLYPHLWWALWSICFYLVIPAAIVIFVFKHGLAEYGMTVRVRPKYLLWYLLMLAVAVPLAVFASGRDDFQSVYPLFRGAFAATPNELLMWEAVYLGQFVALEFFFRGFLVLGLGRYVGRASVWISAIPYCMLHYHKPFLEASASLVAGIILGEVARRSRSILGGVIAHVGAAAAMEILAIGLW